MNSVVCKELCVMPRLVKTATSFVMLVLLSGGISGCGRSGASELPVNPAQGSVMAKGTPALDAIVTLHPTDQSISVIPSGQVDEEGNFVLTTRKPGDGAPAGDYKIAVRWMVQPPLPKPAEQSGVIMSMSGGEGESKVEPKDRLGGAYADPETSGLKCTIIKGQNEIPRIELDLNRPPVFAQPQDGA